MADEQCAISQLSALLPLEDGDLREVISYTNTLSDQAAVEHLEQLLGTSDSSTSFIEQFIKKRNGLSGDASRDIKSASYAPPHGPPPVDSKHVNGGKEIQAPLPPAYTPSEFHQPGPQSATVYQHTNPVIEAAHLRARDEQDMQQALQALQYRYRIFNSEIEPEHDTENYCSCPIHQYQRMKRSRYRVQEKWSKAVMYPGEKAYNDGWQTAGTAGLFSSNPYANRVVSPFGYNISRTWAWGPQRPVPSYHARSIHQTIELNNLYNQRAQASITAHEPKHSIWDDDAMEKAMANLAIDSSIATSEKLSAGAAQTEKPKASRMASFRKSIGIKSSEEKAVGKVVKSVDQGKVLRNQILTEEAGRWPDDQCRQLVNMYQEKVGMIRMIADLRARCPTQYLHLLRAGYFEPIPVAWADQASNPLKFSIESAAGWRGVTPAWRGYEDTAEERLYWVLNHREGSVGMRMKPGMLSGLSR